MFAISHTPMRASVQQWAIAAVTLWIVGCQGEQSRLVGTWTATKFDRRLSADEATPLDATPKPDSADEGNYSIRLQFYRNGRLDTVTTLPNIQTQKSGQWRLISENETAGTAVIECDLMNQRTQHEVEFVGADTIKLVPPNMAGLKLKLEFTKDR